MTETAARPRIIPATPGHAEQILALQRRAGNRELVDRMTALSPSLIFSLDGRELRYEQVAGLDPNEFDRQMMALIDQDPVLPLRLTNRHGLLGDRASGFHDPATRNYARRIGTNFSDAEFDRGHRLGIDAEARILQDFFGDPSIRILRDSPSVTIRRAILQGERDAAAAP
jgi:hypothetical protein